MSDVSTPAKRPSKKGFWIILAVIVGVLLVSNALSSDDYNAPSGPGDPFYYNAIQYQYNQGDCWGLDDIIQAWREPPPDPYADSYISEAQAAEAALGCP